MNISAISMLNRTPNFAAQKQIVHRNSDEDFWIETVEEPKDEVVIHRNSDEDWYPVKVEKKPVLKTVKKQPKPANTSHYEKGPNGEKGVWTRDGGGYAFFTPAKVIEARKATASAAAEKAYQENPEDTKARYLRYGM